MAFFPTSVGVIEKTGLSVDGEFCFMIPFNTKVASSLWGRQDSL